MCFLEVACAMVHVWGSDDNLWCQSLPSTLFETVSFIVNHCILQASWLKDFPGFLCVQRPSHHRSPGTTDEWSVFSFCMSSRDPNPSHQAGMAGTLPAEISPWSYKKIFFLEPPRPRIGDSSNIHHKVAARVISSQCLPHWWLNLWAIHLESDSQGTLPPGWGERSKLVLPNHCTCRVNQLSAHTKPSVTILDSNDKVER